ncbi:MAG: hypothetical protein E7595_02530 [Ruminococcaceae bacterium]|nr:hypothetical protein [Oscillospiraceae bacterium]
MSQFDPILSSMKNEDFPTKKHLLEYLLHIISNIKNEKKPLEQEDTAAMLEYAYSEVDEMLAAIKNAETYKEKDVVFDCEDLLLGLIMNLCPTPQSIPESILKKIDLLVQTVNAERYIENTVDEIFKQDSIEAPETERLLGLVAKTTDEYQKCKLYAGLVHYKNDLSKFSRSAKELVSTHLEAELKRYLSVEQLNEDHIGNLELISDISKSFITEEIVSLLYEVLKLRRSNIDYYAVESLLSSGNGVPEETIVSLARNLEYASLTYGMLGSFGKQDLFPNEYTSPEYLAKSDMVHWLVYPTELGKEPDAIEYVGKISYLFKKEVYHVFKFRSDSDNLTDDLKNEWLIVWSSDKGGTFSNFDKYSAFEKETVQSTLKNIKKNLIG